MLYLYFFISWGKKKNRRTTLFRVMFCSCCKLQIRVESSTWVCSYMVHAVFCVWKCLYSYLIHGGGGFQLRPNQPLCVWFSNNRWIGGFVLGISSNMDRGILSCNLAKLIVNWLLYRYITWWNFECYDSTKFWSQENNYYRISCSHWLLSFVCYVLINEISLTCHVKNKHWKHFMRRKSKGHRVQPILWQKKIKIKSYNQNCFKQAHSKHLCTRILGYKASFGNDYLKNTSTRKRLDLL